MPSLDPALLPKGRFALGISIDDDVAQLEAKGFANSSETTQVTGSKDAARYISQMPKSTDVGVAAGDLRPGVRAMFDTLGKSAFAKEFLDGVDSAETESGLSLPEDLLTVLGDAASVTYENSGEHLAIRTHPESVSSARRILDKIAALAADEGEPFEIETSGRDVILSDDADFAKQVSTSSGLSETALFRKAIGDLPSAPQLVAFVNLEHLLSDIDDDTARHFGAVGVLVKGDSANPSMVIRLVVR
jgi:hypothetical protein